MGSLDNAGLAGMILCGVPPKVGGADERGAWDSWSGDFAVRNITKRAALAGAAAGLLGVLSWRTEAGAVTPDNAAMLRQARAVILRSLRQGVLVLKAWPGEAGEVRARSWSGGLPRMPADLAWPVRAKTGKPMSFLAQIDLSELPPMARTQGLPATGVLWFFTDLNDTIDEADQVAVLYRPAAGDWPERAAPAGLPSLSGEPPYSLFPEGDPLAAVAVRQTMSFRAVDTYAEDYQHLPPAALDMKGLDTVLWDISRSALVRTLGERETPPSRDWKALGDPDWPQTGLFAELGARVALGALPWKGRYTKDSLDWTAEGLALRQDLEADASTRVDYWRARRFEPLAPTERAAFQAWLRDFVRRCGGLTPDKAGGHSPPTKFDFEYPLRDTPVFAAYQVLAHGGPGVDSLPAALRQPRVWGPDNATSDQMLGHGHSEQDAPYVNRNNVLLLQMTGGDDALWLGEGMMLHFWITPADLAARRFDRVFPTYEGD
jgi:hypothetical protein